MVIEILLIFLELGFELEALAVKIFMVFFIILLLVPMFF